MQPYPTTNQPNLIGYDINVNKPSSYQCDLQNWQINACFECEDLQHWQLVTTLARVGVFKDVFLSRMSVGQTLYMIKEG